MGQQDLYIFDMGMTTAVILLGGLAYMYEFDNAGFAAYTRSLRNKLTDVSLPDVSRQLQIDANYNLEDDIKSLVRNLVHKESVAALLLSKIKTEHNPAKQKEIFVFINAAALQGNPLAQFAMGMFYGNGYLNVFKDVNLAIYWFKQSADHGNVDAQLELGKLYLMEPPNPNNPVESEFWLRQAADHDSTVARDMLRENLDKNAKARSAAKTMVGLIAQAGNGDPEAKLALLRAVKAENDPKQQAFLVNALIAAAKINNASAGYLLGMSYQNGYLVLPKNEHSAMTWYKQSALYDNMDAQLAVGKLYLTGDPDIQDPAEAALWLKQAADQGATIAQDMLRHKLDTAANINRKDQNIANLLARAGAGDPAAKLALLKTITEEHDTTLQNPLIVELIDAAMANNTVAAYLLGVSHQNGYLNLPKNILSALSWFKESASHGNVDAQLELGKLYLLGGPDISNPSAAEFWLKQAADRGSVAALELLSSQRQGSKTSRQ